MFERPRPSLSHVSLRNDMSVFWHTMSSLKSVFYSISLSIISSYLLLMLRIFHTRNFNSVTSPGFNRISFLVDVILIWWHDVVYFSFSCLATYNEQVIKLAWWLDLPSYNWYNTSNYLGPLILLNAILASWLPNEQSPQQTFPLQYFA